MRACHSHHDVFPAVDPDDVAGDPVGALVAEGGDGAGHVLGRRHPSGGISRQTVLDQILVPRYLSQSRGVGDAGPDGVGGDAPGRQLEGELPDVGIKCRFRRRDGAVARAGVSSDLANGRAAFVLSG